MPAYVYFSDLFLRWTTRFSYSVCSLNRVDLLVLSEIKGFCYKVFELCYGDNPGERLLTPLSVRVSKGATLLEVPCVLTVSNGNLLRFLSGKLGADKGFALGPVPRPTRSCFTTVEQSGPGEGGRCLESVKTGRRDPVFDPVP